MSIQPMSDQRPPTFLAQTRAIEISTIIIGDRHRRDFGDLQPLADSIAELGLLQPIGITADRVLVFGERRLRAVRDVLGRDKIDVRVVDVSSIVAGEYAENEMRKDFTPSERVAIAEAVRQELAGRHGSNRFEAKGIEVDGGPPLHGKSRDLAARRAGFDSGRQLDRASNVIRLGVPALVEAMDQGKVSITSAAAIAREAPADQDVIVRMEEPARLEELRRRKQGAADLRATAERQEAETGPTAYTRFLKKNGRLPTEAEARTIAHLDHRATPAETGKRVNPPAPLTSKEERARKKLIDGYGDEIWRTRQALQLLAMNTTDPAVLMEHVDHLDRKVLDENMRAGRGWLNRFAREYRRHAK